MDEIKSILLTPNILDDCLGDESCFHVIKHKRDITLSLSSGDENKNSKYIADQTPTPTTRLIQNCEAAGLFDDLKHVNPFEETFRQAIDCTSKRPSVLLTTQKSLEIIKSNDEDTLHTPHIIPYNSILTDNKIDTTDNEIVQKIDKKCVSDKQTNEASDVLSNESVVTIHVTGPNDDNDIESVKYNDMDTKIKSKVQNKQPSHITKTKASTQNLLRKICPKPVVIAGANPIKEKIRESLLKLRTMRTDGDANEMKAKLVNVHIANRKQWDVKDIPKNEIKQQIAVETNKSKQHNNGANERNREAAKRYRYKQKVLNENLMKRITQLESQNALLKKQLHHFQKSHANCSVTLKHDTIFYSK